MLYEDNHLIAVFKPAGIAVEPGLTGEPSLLELVKALIKEKAQKTGNVFLGIIHRLDKPVSGVILFGKTSKGASRLSEQFRAREVEKIYWALTEATDLPESQTLVHYLSRDEEKAVTVVEKEASETAKRAILSYRVLRKTSLGTLLEIELETGRKHQIRSQLAAIGAPIVGDKKYGAKTKFENGIALVSKRISFEHPVRKEERITVEVPKSLCPLEARL